VLEELELARGIEPPTCGLQIAKHPAPVQQDQSLSVADHGKIEQDIRKSATSRNQESEEGEAS
jgi:hypothetical protein